MLSRYNRRMDDDTIGNYMDVCKAYTESDVEKATKYLTGAMERLPYPRDLEQYLSKQCKPDNKMKECSVGKCTGEGYYKADYVFDYGLKDYDPPRYLRCSCHYATGPDLPKFSSSLEELKIAKAVILAAKIAAHAVDNEALSSVEQWARYFWHEDEYKQYKTLANKINLNKLLYVDEFLTAYPPTDCQAMPMDVATEIIEKIIPLPDKKWVNYVG